MTKIGETIIEEGITNFNDTKKRNTVRAIILNDDDEIFLLYSELFNDYTFPGGGIKYNEDHLEALKREIREETGAKDIEVIEPFGYTLEYRYGISGNLNIYEQKSYYYFCKIDNLSDPNYVGRELEQGLKMKWVKIKDVIKHNNQIYENRENIKGFSTVLLRERQVLEQLVKKYEKIWNCKRLWK